MLELSAAEQGALARSGLATFEDRIIHQARQPIDEATLAAVAKRCAGPIPEGLLALWRTSFGGSLDYDLRATFERHEASVSLRELFWPGSDGYRDLWGWIEHEEDLARDAAEEAGTAWSGKLEHLPFGGFDYLERVYVEVAPGPDHGAVFLWMKGLPPAWRFSLHQDSVVRLADDVPALFRQLAFETDPTTTGDPHASGLELMEHLEALSGQGAAGASARDKLLASVRRATLDWRAAMADGTIAGSVWLRHLALEAAIDTDDVDLLVELERLGCSLDERLGGGATVLERALAVAALRCARVLLDRGLQSVDGVRNAAHHAPPDLIRELLARGADADDAAVMIAAAEGHLDSAMLIADAALAEHPALRGALRQRALERARDELGSATRLEAGTLASHLTADQYRERAARLRTLADRLAPGVRSTRTTNR